MSSQVLPSVRRRLPLRRRIGAVVAVAAARILATRSPDRIRAVLTVLRRGARPADPDRTLAAHEAVRTVSTRCSGEYCIQRSLATALLCRLSGTWPTWCVGVRPDPFSAHAWVEVDGRPIGEPFGADYYHRLMSVPPLADGAPVA
jgi:hypothetical protein